MRRTLALVALAISACSGPSASTRGEVDSSLSRRRFAAAAARIRAAQDEYGPANAVLYDLDLAQALADAGERAEADRRFADAQDRMDRLWTVSVSRRAGAALANENVDDYRGEDFERVLSHVLRGVNLLAMGKRRDALIEAQNAERFLDELRGRAAPGAAFRDEGFVRWLAARLYEDEGQPDDARISDEAAVRAYSVATSTSAAPPAPAGGAGAAELVLIQLDGTVPRKTRKAGGGALGFVLAVSYPEYGVSTRPVLCGLSAGSSAAAARTAEDVDAIARKTLAERLALLKARSTLRAAVKLAGTAAGVNAVDSEFADIRGWSTLPARVAVARLRVPAGEGLARVSCADGRGGRGAERTFAYSVPPGGRAWLVERTED